MSSQIHSHPVRVYYEDTDAGGIVFYANYLGFAERGRTEMLRAIGVESSKLMNEDGIALAVRKCTAEYLKPAVLDDLLSVDTELVAIGGASLQLKQTVKRNQETLVEIDIILVCLNLKIGGATRLPDNLRQSLSAVVPPTNLPHKGIRTMKEQV